MGAAGVLYFFRFGFASAMSFTMRIIHLATFAAARAWKKIEAAPLTNHHLWYCRFQANAKGLTVVQTILLHIEFIPNQNCIYNENPNKYMRWT